jgi:hypothetical protein
MSFTNGRCSGSRAASGTRLTEQGIRQVPPVSSPSPPGGGSGAPSPRPSGSGTPSSPSPNPSSTATAAPGTASLRFTVYRNAASSKRRPMGVPAAAQLLVVTINSVNGNTTLPPAIRRRRTSPFRPQREGTATPTDRDQRAELHRDNPSSSRLGGLHVRRVRCEQRQARDRHGDADSEQFEPELQRHAEQRPRVAAGHAAELRGGSSLEWRARHHVLRCERRADRRRHVRKRGDDHRHRSDSSPTVSLTATESGWSNAFTTSLDPATCYASGNPVVSVTTTDNQTFTVKAQAAGLCKLIVTGAPGQSADLRTSASAASIVAQ